MSDLKYDAIVVGAGPAGSIAARILAENDIKTLVLEKRQEIGTPKRCAEGINIDGLERIGLKPDPAWAIREIRGAILYSPSGRPLKIVLDKKGGYVIERKIFEKYLARDAIRAGARYMVKTLATRVIRKNGKVVGLNAIYMGNELEIRSKLIIAADGVDSKIARSAGLKTENSLTDYHSGFQYEMAGLNLNGSDLLHLYFGNEIAPKGYLWIFPKDDDVANVGIGILGKFSDKGNKAKDYLDKFIKDHSEIFKDSSAIEINAGGIPVGFSVDSSVTDGLMVVGDAAQQVNPIHGGGMALAMNAAKIAAKVGASAIKEGNLSKGRLYEYEKIWRETEGVKIKRLLKLRYFMEKLDDNDLERMIDILSGDDIIRLTKGEYRFLIKIFITKAPKILPLAKRFLV